MRGKAGKEAGQHFLFPFRRDPILTSTPPLLTQKAILTGHALYSTTDTAPTHVCWDLIYACVSGKHNKTFRKINLILYFSLKITLCVSWYMVGQIYFLPIYARILYCTVNERRGESQHNGEIGST